MIDPGKYNYGYMPDVAPHEPPEGDMPRCPVCGAETDTLYRNKEYEIAGCDHCLTYIDAWDWQAEQEAEAS